MTTPECRPLTDAFTTSRGISARDCGSDPPKIVTIPSVSPHSSTSPTSGEPHQTRPVIFHDNDFEIFIDPDGDNHEYEIEITR
jgi:hypothetical protein